MFGFSRRNTAKKQPRDHFRRSMRGFWTIGKFPLVYATMPKSACTTIKNILYTLDKGVEHADPLSIHRDRDGLLNTVWTDAAIVRQAIDQRAIGFTFVREPFARAYSAFSEKIFAETPYSFPQVRALVIDRYQARFPLAGQEYTPVQHSQNFRSFLLYVRDSVRGHVPGHVNWHWAPQSSILESHRRHMHIDLVGRVENFASGMKYVLDIAGAGPSVDVNVRYHEGPRPPFRLSDTLTDEIFGLLTEIYQPDITAFSYGREIAKYRG